MIVLPAYFITICAIERALTTDNEYSEHWKDYALRGAEVVPLKASLLGLQL